MAVADADAFAAEYTDDATVVLPAVPPGPRGVPTSWPTRSPADETRGMDEPQDIRCRQGHRDRGQQERRLMAGEQDAGPTQRVGTWS